MCWGNIHTTQGEELAQCQVEIFMVGDLAFYSMMLGKENMLLHWCWRCSMSKNEWTENVDGPRTGTEWTLEGLNNHLARLQ